MPGSKRTPWHPPAGFAFQLFAMHAGRQPVIYAYGGETASPRLLIERGNEIREHHLHFIAFAFRNKS